MRRREFIALLGGAAAWPFVARAQQTTRAPRVGWLVTGTPTSYRFSLAAFREGLKALGYIEGENINIEYRWAEGDFELLPALANELVHLKVDIIVAGGSVGAKAAKRATSVIPIVAAGVGDLVELGLVTSLAQPGGNLTGFVSAVLENAAKRIQIMKEVIPQATRAAILWSPANNQAKLELSLIRDFATANDIAFEPYDARSVEQLTDAFVRIRQDDPDMVLVLSDPFTFTYRKVIVDAAERSRLPTIYPFREYVDDGGLISYGVSIADTYRRAAGYVDKILRGARPADLPVQLPISFELVVNLKTAKLLGLIIPPTLLARADEVIERGGGRSSSLSPARRRGRWRRERSSREAYTG
jgi:putative ABC transport system substrate-binding protein